MFRKGKILIMGKKLSEMTLEELWQLFPIILTEHNENWEQWYLEERNHLVKLLPKGVTLTHIGSTAIKGIWAKPIIDILIEVPEVSYLPEIRNILISHDYICMSESDNRISLNKGYTENGFAQKVFHIHVRLRGDNDEIAFRDYLNMHPDSAKQYEELKLSLWKEYEHDRDGYTKEKTEFVNRIKDLIRAESIDDKTVNDIIARLKNKDDKVAYEYAKQLGKESASSDKYLVMIPEFAAMLDDKSSYVRTRAFCLICNQARWAKDGQIEAIFERMSNLLIDDKPTVVRQCLGALHEVAIYRPELCEKISQALSRIDLSKYKDSMSPLIEKDKQELISLYLER